jgi:hypothetical protein
MLDAVRLAIGVDAPLWTPWTQPEVHATKLLTALISFIASPANAKAMVDVPDCLPQGAVVPESGDFRVDARVLLLVLASPGAPVTLCRLMYWQNKLRSLLSELTVLRSTLSQVRAHLSIVHY